MSVLCTFGTSREFVPRDPSIRSWADHDSISWYQPSTVPLRKGSDYPPSHRFTGLLSECETQLRTEGKDRNLILFKILKHDYRLPISFIKDGHCQNNFSLLNVKHSHVKRFNSKYKSILTTPSVPLGPTPHIHSHWVVFRYLFESSV